MNPEPEPSDEQLIAELDTFLGSPRADNPRARRIERSMPITFAALREGAPAYSPARAKGNKAIAALAILTPAAAAAIVLVSIFINNRSQPGSPPVTNVTPPPAPPIEAVGPAAPIELTKATPVPEPPPLEDPTTPQLVSSDPPTAPFEEPAVGPTPAPEVPKDVPEEPLWSLLARTNPTPPSVGDEAWVANEIDRFVLAKIEAAGLIPTPEAPPAALLRRLHYDLTGLPPTAEEVRAFIANPSPPAYAKVVNDLLARPQFGEKWARHWLDLAAYDAGVKHSWRYREYVIAAFNKDKPFNHFVAEQIAGDLLPTQDPLRRVEAQVATGFLAMARVNEDEENTTQQRLDQVDAQIDLVTRTFLGLSVACARCHDHKFDPISQRDYHALAGIFESTDTRGGYQIGLKFPKNPAVDPRIPVPKRFHHYFVNLDTSKLRSKIGITDRMQNRAEIKRLTKLVDSYKGRIYAARRRGGTARIARLEENRRSAATRLRTLQNTDFNKVNQSGARAIGLANLFGGGRDSKLRIEGEVERIGEVVPRGFPSALKFPGSEITIPERESGRLELAKWLLSEQNPLTARVFTNRVWEQLMGHGIARQVDEFGTNSQKPTHPELLDYLANRFIEDKWSMKKIIREIVLSRTYRLDSVASGSLLEADPENTLFARRDLRPLGAEELRDSMVAIAGLLSEDSAIPASEHRYLAGGEFGALSSFADGDSFPLSSPFRTIYLPVKDKAPGMLALFDSPEPGSRSPKRADTTSSTQALFMMNNEFVYQAAMEAAFQIRDDKSRRPPERIVQDAFLALLCRPPSRDELADAIAFVEGFSADEDVTNPGIADTVDPIAGRIAQISGIDIAPREDVIDVGTKRRLERLLPWTMLHHALMQTAEFRILR